MAVVHAMKMFMASALGVLSLALAACDDSAPAPYYGYAEGEYVRVASPLAGRLTTLRVHRGDQVMADTPLFALESDYETAARRQAAERLAQAEAQLADLQKGKRPPEIDVIEAQLAQSQSDLKLSKVRLARQQELTSQGVASRDAQDQARTIYQRDVARVDELEAQLAVSRLASRDDQITAAARDVDAQHAALAQADWNLAQKSVTAALAGQVTDTLYVEGEWVPAGSPVVTMLPPENIKVRFFVPQIELGKLAVGAAVTIDCDGCASSVLAHISFISPQAEYTPPVIYSSESRAKLVYLIEARPSVADAPRLHPGQPVDVRLAAGKTADAAGS
jgi:HlyD family secretion protein